MPNNIKVLVISCGCFDPITNMHLRMFEYARDFLKEKIKDCQVVGVISPVHDSYSYKQVTNSKDRCEMVSLALKSSSWIYLDEWESKRKSWSNTLSVLKHYKSTGSYYFKHFRDGEGLVCGNGGEDERDFNNNPTNFIVNRKRKLLKNIAREKMKEGNNNNNDDDDDIENEDEEEEKEQMDLRVFLLCGGDLLHSFAKPGVWNNLDELLGKFEFLVYKREGSDEEKFLYEFDLCYKYKHHIHLLGDPLRSNLSSTKIRRAVKRGESVKYLIDDRVINYIQKHKLYT